MRKVVCLHCAEIDSKTTAFGEIKILDGSMRDLKTFHVS